jgi:S-disulfanyl-L-cysteine oxidoreductase SoxD
VSTLWDYIHRAMPWAQPKSLSTEEVYAVTAYILNMGGVVPDNFTLSDQNIADVQKLLPNRNGMTTEHALWPDAGRGQRKPDVQAVACMKDCVQEVELASFLPDFARDAHGNLAEQNRAVGAQKGADTRKPAAAATLAQAGVAPAAAAGSAAAIALTQKHTCVACHGMDSRIVGPSFRDIAKKYAGGADAAGYLAGKIKAGGTGVWGSIPMPAQALGEADAKVIAQWLTDGARN